MKKILLISAITLSAFSYNAKAQVHVSVNLGLQPLWGPVGYDYVNYYYLPDLGVYYDVPRGLFVYFDMGRWVFAPALPPRFGHYDLYHSYKVVINDRDPWLRDDYYRRHYYNYRGRYQPLIRDSRDRRYFDSPPRYQNRGLVNHEHSDKYVTRDYRRSYGHRDHDRRDHGRHD
jgi:hypothetical protein